MTFSLPFKVWTGALLAHAIATGAALLIAQPTHALSFLVHFEERIAARCAARPWWHAAQSCVGAATRACYDQDKDLTDGQGRSIRGLVLSDCAWRELSFWDAQLDIAYANSAKRGTLSLEEWRENRNPACWKASKPTVAQFFGLDDMPHNHIAECSVPATAKLVFELRSGF